MPPINSSKKRKITLQKIIGSTASTPHQLAISPSTSHYAHLTGSCITITDFLSNRQVKFLVSKSEISAFSFNQSSTKIASGEASGELICWEWKKKKKIWKNPKAHKGRILACEFDAKEEHLVTIGEDLAVKVWKVSSGELIGANRISALSSAHKEGGIRVNSLVWSPDSKFFVTVGDKFVKFWYMESLKKNKRSHLFNTNIIEGRKALLCDVEQAEFASVAMDPNDSSLVYAVTTNGILCTFSTSPRTLQKWVNLKATRAYSIHVTSKSIVCGCADGLIRLFAPKTLHYQGTLPKPPPIHSHLTSASINENIFQGQEGAVPDAVACKVSTSSKHVAAMYSDRSFILWDISDLKRVSKYRSFLSHGGCVWDIDMLPDESDGPLPDGTFVTCSEDNTLRFWNINHDNSERGPELRGSIAEKSIFSRDLLHVVSMPKRDASAGSKEGIRCCKFTPNGCHVLSGDRGGNVRVHDVYKFNAISDQCAHDSEVLSVDATQYEDGSILLASGSRDNLIHLYDLSEDVGTELVDTLSDHSASITSVKFASSGGKLLSCSADKTIVFRNVTPQGGGHYAVDQANKATIPKGKIYDMDTDATQKYIITAGSDKKLHIWNIRSGRSIRNYQVEKKGEPLKVRTDPAGIHAVTSSSDKILRLYDFYSGACYAKFRGHSGVITGLKFTNDCRHLISVGSDGCIFIWKIANDLRKAMQLRMSEMKERKRRALQSVKSSAGGAASQQNIPLLPNLKEKTEDEKKEDAETGNAKTPRLDSITGEPSKSATEEKEDDGVALIFRDTQLPSWARPKTAESRPKTSPSVHPEGGVWAQRIASNMALRPNTASTDEDVQPLLHSTGTRDMSADSTGKLSVDDNAKFHTTAEAEDDVNLSDEESESDKDEDQRSVADEEEQVVYFKQEEEKERFVVASVDELPEMKKEQKKLEEQDEKEEEQLESLEPVEEDVEFPEDNADDDLKAFVKENFGNLDKPQKVDRSSGVRQSFSSAFFRQSVAKSKLQQKDSEEDNKEESEEEGETQWASKGKLPKKEDDNEEETEKEEQALSSPAESEKNDTKTPQKTSPEKQTNETTTPKSEEESVEEKKSSSTPTPFSGADSSESDEKKSQSEEAASENDASTAISSPSSDPGPLAIEAGYGRLSNDAFGTNFRKAAGDLSPPPTPPNDEGDSSRDELKFLRKKYKIPSSLNKSLSSRTQKAKDEAHRGLEEYMKRRKEEEKGRTETSPKSTSSEKQSASPKAEKETEQAQSKEEQNVEKDVEIVDVEDKKTSAPSTAIKPEQPEEKETEKEPTVTTPTKKSDSQVRFDSKSLQRPDSAMLPPRTPDIGQYSNMQQGESMLAAPRALQAVTPMPYQQQKGRNGSNKPPGSIVLRKSVDEYRTAMENLRQSFLTALSMYDEANTELQKSRATMNVSKEEEKPVTDLLDNFQGIFAQMHQKIDERNPLRSSVNASKEQVDLTLDKYSEMLINMVSEKLKKKQDEK